MGSALQDQRSCCKQSKGARGAWRIISTQKMWDADVLRFYGVWWLHCWVQAKHAATWCFVLALRGPVSPAVETQSLNHWTSGGCSPLIINCTSLMSMIVEITCENRNWSRGKFWGGARFWILLNSIEIWLTCVSPLCRLRRQWRLCWHIPDPGKTRKDYFWMRMKISFWWWYYGKFQVKNWESDCKFLFSTFAGLNWLAVLWNFNNCQLRFWWKLCKLKIPDLKTVGFRHA